MTWRRTVAKWNPRRNTLALCVTVLALAWRGASGRTDAAMNWRRSTVSGSRRQRCLDEGLAWDARQPFHRSDDYGEVFLSVGGQLPGVLRGGYLHGRGG